MDNSCEPMDVDLSTHSASGNNNSFKKKTPSPILTSDKRKKHEKTGPDSEATENVNSKNVIRIMNINKTKTERTKSPILSSNKRKKHEKTGPDSEATENVNSKTVIRIININKTKTEKTKNNQSLLLGLLMLLLSIVIYCILDLRCSNSLNLSELKDKLNSRLYGQPEVKIDLIEALAEEANTKILFLYGGTGVGKTYTITLALENIWNSSNIYHYTMPSFLDIYATEAMMGINICDFAIVVVDDLKENDLNIKDQVLEIIKKSENLNKKITIILIYNCDIYRTDFVKKCDSSFDFKLMEAFENVDVYNKFIKFRPLNQEVLKMCVKDELGSKKFNDLEFNNILNNFNVTLDGCKGVYKKIQFLNMP